MEFEIREGRFSFRLTAPYSEERRRAASEWAKHNNVHKKVTELFEKTCYNKKALHKAMIVALMCNQLLGGIKQ